MNLSKILAGAAIIAAPLLVTSPASALDPNADPYPIVHSPIGTKDNNHTGFTLLAIEGPKDFYGLHEFAEEVDEQIDGLAISTTGTCAQHPMAVCVKFSQMGLPDCGCYAQALVYDQPEYDTEIREIQVNTLADHDNMYAVVVHEFGHVLGLGHHALDGIDGGSPDVTSLSTYELDVLREAYPLRPFLPISHN